MIKGFDKETQPLTEYEEKGTFARDFGRAENQDRKGKRGYKPHDRNAVKHCRV